MTYVYVASSWRNNYQPAVCAILTAAKVPFYDFRNPEGSTGFSWSEIDPNWRNWEANEYIKALSHPLAERGFKSDMDALKQSTHCLLVLPCGRSAHLELGWAVGAGKKTAIWTRNGQEPELMAKMCDLVTDNLMEVLEWLDVPN